MKVFGERLRELREEKELSAKALGAAIGVSDAAVLNWENNVNDIEGKYLVRLAVFFHVSRLICWDWRSSPVYA